MLVSGAGFALEPQLEREVRTILSTCMEEVRQRHTGRECDQFERVRKAHGAATVTYLEEYVADPCSRVRWYAYRSVMLLGLDVNDLQARQEIVAKLLMGVRDDAYNSGYLSRWLLQFTSTDFSEASRQLLRELLVPAMVDARTKPREDIILLAGVPDLKSELPRLKQFVDEHEGRLKQQHEQNLAEWAQTVEKMPERRQARFADSLLKQYWQNSLVWAALRARARMGVEEDIARCIALVESHPDEDYRVAWLLKELSYVRQPEVVDYLHKYLKSEKVRESKGPDTVVGTYAQHAAKALAQMLRGFPGRKDIGGDKETIELRRKWMAEQKEWDIIR